MPVQYDYDPKLNAVIVHLKGTVRKDEVLEYIRRLLADDTVQRGYFEIVDFSTTDDYAVSEEDLAEIMLMGEEVSKVKEPQCLYYYADSDKAYRIAQALHALGDDHGMQVEVYRDWEAMVRVMGIRAKESVVPNATSPSLHERPHQARTTR